MNLPCRLSLLAGASILLSHANAADPAPPFSIRYDQPVAGTSAFYIADAQGDRVRYFSREDVAKGPAAIPWNLKLENGNFVAPGTYQVKGIAGPPLELIYQVTPYPNVDQLWPGIPPWSGWLSDHNNNHLVATRGDKVYFATNIGEAGDCLIECDLDGRKVWKKHDFNIWNGPQLLAADQEAVYAACLDNTLWRVDAASHEARKLGQFTSGPERRGIPCAMTARDGRVYLAFTDDKMLDVNTSTRNLDLENCIPKADKLLIQALRLDGVPPGIKGNPQSDKPQGNGVLDIESTLGSEKTQYSVISFSQPVPLGSIAFPAPPADAGYTVRFSVLKPDAAYPPRPAEENDWTPFAESPLPGWNVLPAPASTLTRAIRVAFTRTEEPAGPWFGKLEGMMLLSRRFENLHPSARVSVSSGEIAPDGEWDAKRTMPLSAEMPGVFLMQWDSPQKIAGLAFKEVDGAETEIDVWQGPAPKEFPMDAPAHGKLSNEPGWRNVTTYKQVRRSAQYNKENSNKFARYVDGYVSFPEEIETPVVRLRVTSQWFDNGPHGDLCRRHDGRNEHGKHFRESYATFLDTRICKILGVAPVKYLGGEPRVDPLMYSRIEVRDGKTGELLKELPVQAGWFSLGFDDKGQLFTLTRQHRDISRIDLETGAATVVVKDANASRMCVGPDGLFYVFPWTNGYKDPIQVFDPAGKKLRTIGHPGGFQAGAWDPQRFGDVMSMAVDAGGSLWVVEGQGYPRRTVQYRTDGTFVKEILGNTHYGNGGGGNLDRYDGTKAWYGPVEFVIDQSRHTSRIRSLLATDIPADTDFVAMRIKGSQKTYLTTAPMSMRPWQMHGVVYIYDEASGTVKMAAAMGDGTFFEPLRSSAIAAKLNGDVPRNYSFIWSDINGDGKVDADEVQFREKADKRLMEGIGRFDKDMGATGINVRYAVKEVLPNGVPVYERQPAPGIPSLRLSDGRFFNFSSDLPGKEGPQNFVQAADGKVAWSYPATQGVSGLYIPPWIPGKVTNQFSILGHEVAPEGDLGEFLVIHGNTGEWNVWTSDGLVAGQIFLHKYNPKVRTTATAKEYGPGLRLDPLTANQEHFHGYFTRVEPDKKYYAIAGFVNMSVIEVKGLEQFRRFSAPLTITQADIEKVQAWEKTQIAAALAATPKVIPAARVKTPIVIDGDYQEKEWPTKYNMLGDGINAAFLMAYDDENLYLCWGGQELGAFRNSGEDFQRYFKTGAAVDVMLAVDPAADPKRDKPAAGDMRILVAQVNGKPQVVLYQPVCPGAPKTDAWTARTPAGGVSAFDRVAVLSDATVRIGAKGGKTVVEAAIPLKDLGLKITPGMKIKGDVGILSSTDGMLVKERKYWANKTATGTADEAVESRLEPALWGTFQFE